MLASTKQNEIIIAENIDPIIYDFGIAQQIVSPEETSKNQITATIEKTFVKKDQIGYLYTIKVVDRKQSNTDDMFGLEQELASLQKNIALYTNQQGEITTIINRGQIAEDWYDHAKRVKKEFDYLIPEMNQFLTGIDELVNDNESFVSLVKKSEIYSLLFPPIYNQKLMQKIVIQQEKDFENFFDTTTLPLTIDTAVSGINANTKGKQLLRSGKLDTARFDKTSASELFTKSYGVHEYGLNFDTSYLETFDLDQKNQVDKANAMLGVKVNDLYQLKQISKLKKRN